MLESKYKSIDDYLNDPNGTYPGIVNQNYMNYVRKGGKATMADYFAKHKILYRNKEAGIISESVFQMLEGGIKPRTGIQAAGFTRFIDNLIDNTAREIKSGRITFNSTNFKKQIMVDIAIAKNRIMGISRVEWHALGGIDDEAMSFIYSELKISGMLGSDKFIIYIY